jgi:hypothetical protein
MIAPGTITDQVLLSKNVPKGKKKNNHPDDDDEETN